MFLPQIPNEITWGSVSEALKGLGIPVVKLREVRIVPGSIELTYFRTVSEDEEHIAPGSSTGLSFVKTTIRIKIPENGVPLSAEGSDYPPTSGHTPRRPGLNGE